MVGGKYVNKGGYLIEIDETGTQGYGVYYKENDDGTEIVRYNGEIILTYLLPRPVNDIYSGISVPSLLIVLPT